MTAECEITKGFLFSVEGVNVLICWGQSLLDSTSHLIKVRWIYLGLVKRSCSFPCSGDCHLFDFHLEEYEKAEQRKRFSSVHAQPPRPAHLSPFTLQVKTIRRYSSANVRLFFFFFGKTLHQRLLWLPLQRLAGNTGCLAPVASMWRVPARPCVEPWCLRTAYRERPPTSPSLCSTRRWWACFWSLTTRCGHAKLQFVGWNGNHWDGRNHVTAFRHGFTCIYSPVGTPCVV